jgi:hypothetical protein
MNFRRHIFNLTILVPYRTQIHIELKEGCEKLIIYIYIFPFSHIQGFA